MLYDTAIIGTGPAGLSAAINLRLHEKSVIWFGSLAMSQRVQKSERIANYPGIPMVTGPELNSAFQRHAEELSLSITDKMVSGIVSLSGKFALTAENDVYQARTLLLATGVANVGELKYEATFVGKGVSYCATCDGFLYKGKTIAVLCMDPRFEHEVSYLAELAQKVHLYTPYSGCGVSAANITDILLPPIAVYGQERTQGIVLRDSSQLPVDGIFIMRSAIAPASLLPGIAMEDGHIAIDRRAASSIPGCFAAGDCTGRPYQIAKAIGEGNVAADSIIKYLAVHT